MIIDCHTHLASPMVLPPVFFDGWTDNIRRLLPPKLPRAHVDRIAQSFRLALEDPDGDQLIADMDAAGVDVAVLHIIDFELGFPGRVTPLDEVFAAHRRVLARHPGRVVVFAGVDPRRGKSGVELFERSIAEWGFKGLKLYPPCGFSPSDPALDPFYDLCAQHRVPVLTHTGPTTPRLSFRHTHPSELDDAARRFPTVDFVLGHGSVVHRDDAALLAEFRPNIYLDTAGFQVVDRQGEWSSSVAFFKRRGLLRKLLFGTDWPIHSQVATTAAARQRLAGPDTGGLTPMELQWILETNAREVLKIDAPSSAPANTTP
ncbi:MAG: amidohydrolase [Deltaproteobacteria bacterium]|nr:amidohydrolase [Deltaproteobacteria bacterium]